MTEPLLDFDAYSKMTVTLDLDNGSAMECDVVSVFVENDQNYIALTPTGKAEDGAAEVYFYRLEGASEDELSIGNIEDDEEYQDVAERFEELIDEQEFSDMLLNEQD